MESIPTIDLSQTIGECGRFQLFLTVAAHAATASAAFGMMIMVFGMYNPGFICLDDTQGHNNASFTSNASADVCSLFFAGSSQSSNDLHQNKSIETLNVTAIASKCERWTFKTGAATLVTEWNLVCDLAWVPSVIISIQMTGVFLGSYVSGQISERFGRKKGLYISVAFHGLCHLLASFLVSWEMCATVYFFIGIGVGGILVCSFPYPLEFINGWWRGVFSGIPFWPIGYFTYAVVVFILRDWRNIHIAIAVFSFLVLLLGIWTPESVRWLAVTGKVSQSKKVVARIARINRQPCPDTSAIDEIAREEKKIMGGHKYTYIDLFRSPYLRSTTIKLTLIWTFLSYIYYVLNYSFSAFSGDFYTNLLISAVLEFPGILYLSPLLNRLGRRTTALLIIVLDLICYSLLILLSFVIGTEEIEKSIYGLVLISKILNISSWGVFTVYTPELYPTVVRSLNFGFLNGISRLGAILSPYLIPGNPNNFYVCFIVIGIMGVIRFALVFSLPETKASTMKDTVFDCSVARNTSSSNNREQVHFLET